MSTVHCPNCNGLYLEAEHEIVNGATLVLAYYCPVCDDWWWPHWDDPPGIARQNYEGAIPDWMLSDSEFFELYDRDDE